MSTHRGRQSRYPLVKRTIEQYFVLRRNAWRAEAVRAIVLTWSIVAQLAITNIESIGELNRSFNQL